MPSSSKKQHNFMAAIAHSPSFAKKAGVPQSVGKDFTAADKGRTFSKGGDTMATKGKMAALFGGKESKAEESKEKKAFPTKAGYKKAEAKFEGEKFASGGFVRSADGIAKKGKTKAKQIAMACGGKVKGKK